MRLSRDILNEISSFLGSEERLKRELNKCMMTLLVNANHLYFHSGGRKAKHVAEGIVWSLLKLCTGISKEDPEEEIFWDVVVQTAFKMGVY